MRRRAPLHRGADRRGARAARAAAAGAHGAVRRACGGRRGRGTGGCAPHLFPPGAARARPGARGWRRSAAGRAGRAGRRAAEGARQGGEARAAAAQAARRAGAGDPTARRPGAEAAARSRGAGLLRQLHRRLRRARGLVVARDSRRRRGGASGGLRREGHPGHRCAGALAAELPRFRQAPPAPGRRGDQHRSAQGPRALAHRPGRRGGIAQRLRAAAGICRRAPHPRTRAPGPSAATRGVHRVRPRRRAAAPPGRRGAVRRSAAPDLDPGRGGAAFVRPQGRRDRGESPVHRRRPAQGRVRSRRRRGGGGILHAPAPRPLRAPPAGDGARARLREPARCRPGRARGVPRSGYGAGREGCVLQGALHPRARGPVEAARRSSP